MKNDLSDVKVGDILFSCIRMEYVEVENVKDDCLYPIELTNGDHFTFNGKYVKSDEHPILFKTAQDAIEYISSLPQPLPDLAIDTPIIVWNNSLRYKRHFYRWNNAGDPICFMGGRTSWSGDEECVKSWKHWELAKEESEVNNE